MNLLINSLAFLTAFVFMEGFAWFMHKYIMHGIGWFLHKSHHTPRKGRFEWNDVYAVVFAAPAIYLMWIGTPDFNWIFWAGTGISAYGFCYFGFHDVLVHRRMHHRIKPAGKYLQRIIRAHKVHHKNTGRLNGEAFGFLFALPKYDVKSTKNQKD